MIPFISYKKINTIQIVTKQAGCRALALGGHAPKSSCGLEVLSLGRRISALMTGLFLSLGVCFKNCRLACKELFLQAYTGRCFQFIPAVEPLDLSSKKIVIQKEGDIFPIKAHPDSELNQVYQIEKEKTFLPVVDVVEALIDSDDSTVVAEFENDMETLDGLDSEDLALKSSSLDDSVDLIKEVRVVFEKLIKDITPRPKQKIREGKIFVNKKEFVAFEVARYLAEAAGYRVRANVGLYYTQTKRDIVPSIIGKCLAKIDTGTVSDQRQKIFLLMPGVKSWNQVPLSDVKDLTRFIFEEIKNT